MAATTQINSNDNILTAMRAAFTAGTINEDFAILHRYTHANVHMKRRAFNALKILISDYHQSSCERAAIHSTY